MVDCTYELIKNAKDKCLFVQSCEYESNYNFMSLYYCNFGENLFAWIPLWILLVLLCFYVLATTADWFVSPALEYISRKLKLSENLAGATLLAFGNGAVDVIASLSAAGNE